MICHKKQKHDENRHAFFFYRFKKARMVGKKSGASS